MSASDLPDVGDARPYSDAAIKSLRHEYKVGTSQHGTAHEALGRWLATLDALRAERDALAAYKRRTSGLVGELERERDAATRLKEEAVGLVKNIRDTIACSSTIELASSVGGSALDGRDVKRGVLLIFDVFLRATDAGGKSNTGASEGGSNG